MAVMYKPNNAPAPDALLLTAREALKSVLSKADTDHRYTVLMAMNAMGIAARAIQVEAPPPAHPEMNDETFKRWLRDADESVILEGSLIAGLHRHVEGKLAVANPRFKPEATQE